jgi:hypothetical protein
MYLIALKFRRRLSRQETLPSIRKLLSIPRLILIWDTNQRRHPFEDRSNLPSVLQSKEILVNFGHMPACEQIPNPCPSTEILLGTNTFSQV